jgi:hypothetical protein
MIRKEDTETQAKEVTLAKDLSTERKVRKERRSGNKRKSRERKTKTKEAQAKEARA